MKKKKYFSLIKNWGMAIQIECSRLEQISLRKSLMSEKCGSNEIYRRIYDVFEEACLSLENILTHD